MAFKRKNRWDVQVAFAKWSFGIKSRSDVEQTPETVVAELEEFCERVRKVLASDELRNAAPLPSLEESR